MNGKREDWIDVLRDAAVSGGEDKLPEALWGRISESLAGKPVPLRSTTAGRRRQLYIWSASVAAAVLAVLGLFMVWPPQTTDVMIAQDPVVLSEHIGEDVADLPDVHGGDAGGRDDTSQSGRDTAAGIAHRMVSVVGSPDNPADAAENDPIAEKTSTTDATAAKDVTREFRSPGSRENSSPDSQSGDNKPPFHGLDAVPDYLPYYRKQSERRVMVALAANGVGTLSNSSASGSSTSAMASTSLLPNREGMMVLDMAKNTYTIDYGRYNYRHRQPLTFALTFDIGVGGNFFAGTGVSYTRLSSKASLPGSSGDIKQLVQYVGIPVSAKWAFLNTDLLTLYAGVEVQPEFCVGAKFGEDNPDMRTMQFSAHAVAGAQINIGDRFGIYAEPKLSHYFLDTELNTIRNTKGVNFNLQLGLRFTY